MCCFTPAEEGPGRGNSGHPSRLALGKQKTSEQRKVRHSECGLFLRKCSALRWLEGCGWGHRGLGLDLALGSSVRPELSLHLTIVWEPLLHRRRVPLWIFPEPDPGSGCSQCLPTAGDYPTEYVKWVRGGQGQIKWPLRSHLSPSFYSPGNPKGKGTGKGQK